MKRFRTRSNGRKHTPRYLAEPLEPRTLLATTIYVDAASTAPTPDGQSWSTAYPDLQQALAIATSGDQIHIAQGTYKPTATTNRTISFNLKDGVQLLGGYAGLSSPIPDTRDWALYPTILSGDIGQPGGRTDNSYCVLRANDVGASTLLDGMIVTAGNANALGDNSAGGGICLKSSSMRISHCVFTFNSATTGAALSNASSSPLITDCLFSDNLSSGYGGGMANLPLSSPTIINCTFRRNMATSGGGIYERSASPQISNCFFEGNSAYTKGGGLCNDYSAAPLIANCTFIGNTAASGGGMYNIAQLTSKIEIINCTLIANTASSGGAMYNASNIPVENCIIWGNKAALDAQVHQSQSTTSIADSDVQGGFAGDGNLDVAPLFLRNPSAGADGQWSTADDDYGDLHLQPNSPCIDAGSNAALPAGTTTDLDNNLRISNTTVDMGAYEVQYLTPEANAPITLTAGTAILTSQATLSSLTLSNSTNLYLSPGHNIPLILSSLSLSPTSTLDLADNDLILNYTDQSPEQTLQQLANHTLIASQASNSTFSQSARTLAVFDNQDAHFSTFANQPLDPNFNQVLVKYTYLGDANADGKVDPTDYAVLDGKIGIGHSWITGDLNFDGKVDPSDYAQIDGNQGAGQGGLGGPQLASLPTPLPPAPAASPAPANSPTPAQTLPVPAPSPFSTSPVRPHDTPDDLLEILNA